METVVEAEVQSLCSVECRKAVRSDSSIDRINKRLLRSVGGAGVVLVGLQSGARSSAPAISAPET